MKEKKVIVHRRVAKDAKSIFLLFFVDPACSGTGTPENNNLKSCGQLSTKKSDSIISFLHSQQKRNGMFSLRSLRLCGEI